MDKVFAKVLSLAVLASELVGFVVLPEAVDLLVHLIPLCKGRV